MPFDSTNFDYTKVQPVYDRDNPPKRMSEAIRMAVADVEAQDGAGIQYNYMNCAKCTAGSVMRRVGANDPADWYCFGHSWGKLMEALSHITMGNLVDAYGKWPSGFSSRPEVTRVSVGDPDYGLEEWSEDMLALADRLEAEGS